MAAPQSPGPDDSHPVNRLVECPTIDELLPTTRIDHLLSEEERQEAEQERKKFEIVGRITPPDMQAAIYRHAYESACEEIASGMSHEEFRAKMGMSADIPDTPFAPLMTLVRQAFEDALAGRSPRK